MLFYVQKYCHFFTYYLKFLYGWIVGFIYCQRLCLGLFLSRFNETKVMKLKTFRTNTIFTLRSNEVFLKAWMILRLPGKTFHQISLIKKLTLLCYCEIESIMVKFVWVAILWWVNICNCFKNKILKGVYFK